MKTADIKWTKLCKGATEYSGMQNLRSSVKDACVQGDDLVLVLASGAADPMAVYRYLFDLPRDKVIRRFPVRTGFTFEKTGVLDLAKTRDMRDAFIRSFEEAADGKVHDDALAAYISGNQCVMDINRLIGRDYRIYEEGYPHPENGERLAGLIEFTAGCSGIDEEDDPALMDYLKMIRR